MPNWCNNTFEMVAPKEKVREFEKFLNDSNGKDWFDFFKPCPQELKDVGDVAFNHTNEELVKKYGYADWYSWSVDNWGCKWNCDANDWHVDEYDEENLSISFWFDSPWGPPIALYEFISQDESVTIFGNYHEEGMCFVGRFEYGSDACYEYSDLESLDDIPEEILDEWNIREMLEERADWEEEDEEEEPTEEELRAELDEIGKEYVDNAKGDKKWPN